MTTRHELEAIDSIVNIDTFHGWLETWRTRVLTDHRIPRASRQIPRTDEMAGSQGIYISYPWTDIPLSLQTVIAVQYEAANLADPSKQVIASVEKNEMRFNLYSAAVTDEGSIDTYGEAYVGSGVSLQFGDNPLLVKFLGEDFRKGRWGLFKFKPAMKGVIEKIATERVIDEATMDMILQGADNSTVSSATSFGLRDIARLLTKAKRRNMDIVYFDPI